jgi:NADH dehydrogenase FAD-containing subunit
LHLEKRLAGVPDVEIVLAARENFLLFTPMLHEVAGGDVAVTDVVQALRVMLRRTRVLILGVNGCIFRYPSSLPRRAKRLHIL